MTDLAADRQSAAAAAAAAPHPGTVAAAARQPTPAAGRPTNRATSSAHLSSPSTRTSPGQRDLSTRDDLEHLLRQFYSRVLGDPLLRPVFVDVVDMDLEAHLPRITDFWQRALFGTGAYDGRTMEVHRRIHQLVPLTSAHFDRWLDLWHDVVLRHHAGPMAERAVAHADRMATVFLRNLTGPAGPGRPLPIVARSSNTG